MTDPTPTTPIHILFIDRSDSTCGACGKETLPDGKSHDRVAGYGGGAPGCGAVWTHVSSHYSGMPALEHGAAAMRPDLQWIDPSEAIGLDARMQAARRNVPGGPR